MSFLFEFFDSVVKIEVKSISVNSMAFAAPFICFLSNIFDTIWFQEALLNKLPSKGKVSHLLIDNNTHKTILRSPGFTI